MGSRADEYRRLAWECLQLIVHTIATEEARLALVEMARVWTRLADEQEAALRGEPVVLQQQQQQPQPKGDDTQ